MKTLLKLTLTSLVLVGCGIPAPAPESNPEPPGLGTLATELRVQPGLAGGARTQSDPAADGGVTVALLGGGHAATFVVPAGGPYIGTLRARQTPYLGNAVLSLRVGGAERAKVELTGTTYAPAGSVRLQSGETLSAVFTNDAYGGTGKDRNAFVDYLVLTPEAAPAPTPAPAPVPAGTDVRTFGAKGDGVTDDTAALQRAAASGQSLHFPPGTYRTSAGISWSDAALTLTGEGATLRSTMTSGTALLRFTRSRVTVTGLTVIGAGTGTSWIDGVRLDDDRGSVLRGLNVSAVGGVGISVHGGSGTLLEGNTVSQARYHGIWGNRASQQTWRGNTLTGPGRAVVTGAIGMLGTLGGGYLIENNVVREYGNTATKTEGASNVTYRGNAVDGFAKDGIKIMPYPEGGVTQVTAGVIENNTVRGYTGAEPHGSSALQLSSVLGGRVSGNTVQGSFGQDAGGVRSPNGYEDAIRLQAHGAGPAPQDIVVSGNRALNTAVGLRLAGRGVTVSDNRVERVAQYSVIFIERASNQQLTGNTFTGAGGISVLFDHGVSGITFTRNAVTAPSTGVYAANSGNTANTFRENHFTGTSKAIVLGSGNTCAANTGSGVSLSCQ